jgi:hypothetical protein
MKEQTTCHAINLTNKQENILNSLKDLSGKSKNSILSEMLGFGLKKSYLEATYKTMFMVKVRIDTQKVIEMGQKLQNGDLDTSNLLFTYCIKDDFTVGINLWLAKDREHFEQLFSPHKQYYKEILEIKEVIFPAAALNLILQNI